MRTPLPMELKDFKHSLQQLQKCDQIWDEMKPVAGGRHCQKCSKRIVDFSRMTYMEIALFMSEQAEGVCGFYLPEQLPHYENRKKALPAAIGVTALLSAITTPQISASAQPSLHIAAMEQSGEQGPVYQQASDTIPQAQTTWLQGIIQGFDSTTNRRETIPYASAFIKDTKTGTVSDENGAFRLKYVSKDESGLVTLVIARIGYKRIEIPVDIKGQSEMDLGIITVTPQPSIEYYLTVKTNKWKRFWRKMTRPFCK